ncbi:MAG: hypothetical protein ACHQHN_14655 [Sphingobacteriales bacterium]
MKIILMLSVLTLFLPQAYAQQTSDTQQSNKSVKAVERSREVATIPHDPLKNKKKQRKIENNVVVIDLASPATVLNYQVANGEPFKVRIINMAPGATYSLNNTTTIKPVPPLDNPQGAATPTDKSKKTISDSLCTDMQKKMDATTTEVDFLKLLTQAKQMAGCLISSVYDDLSTFNYNGGKSIVLMNETLQLTVTNSTTKKNWTITFDTKEEGKFLTTYGFTYIPFTFEKPKIYYAQPVTLTTPGQNGGAATTSTAYNILQGSSEPVFDFAPTVIFHYLAYNSNKWSISYTGGVGINLNTTDNNGVSPVVLAGGSLLYHQNIGFSFGLAAHAMSQLKGKYFPGQQITTNLEASDLNTNVTRLDPFFSITFRFSSNPFKSKSIVPSDSTPTTSDQTPPAPSPK